MSIFGNFLHDVLKRVFLFLISVVNLKVRFNLCYLHDDLLYIGFLGPFDIFYPSHRLSRIFLFLYRSSHFSSIFLFLRNLTQLKSFHIAYQKFQFFCIFFLHQVQCSTFQVFKMEPVLMHFFHKLNLNKGGNNQQNQQVGKHGSLNDDVLWK